jgi:hypothetical protein
MAKKTKPNAKSAARKSAARKNTPKKSVAVKTRAARRAKKLKRPTRHHAAS